MLVAEFTVTLFMIIIITGVLSVALILLKRFIQNNNYTQNGDVNKYVIALHLFTNVLAYTGIGMLIENFMWISNPTRSCVEILQDAIRSYKIFKALLVLLFLSQLSEYYICNRYADQGAKIQTISERRKSSIASSFLEEDQEETQNQAHSSRMIINNKEVQKYLTRGYTDEMSILVLQMFSDDTFAEWNNYNDESEKDRDTHV